MQHPASVQWKPTHWKMLCALLACVSTGYSGERFATPASSIRVPPGFQIELLRSAQPDEGSWISLTFDDRGRMILGEDQAGLLRLTLGESPATTSLEKLAGTESLSHCRGVRYALGSLYVCATNGKGLYRLRDADGDGTFDDMKLIVPLDYRSRYGHGANQITLGPDGMLYLAAGNDVSVPDQLDARSPYRHWQNDWLLPSPHDAGQDERVGYVLRFDPDGGSRTVIAGGLRNHIDVVFNSDGEMFTWDADMEWDVGLPWYRPTRLNHIVSGGEYGWRWGTGKWPAWSPDSLPPNVETGLGSPTGLTFGTASNWPERYRTALFGADWQNGRILMIDLIPAGASYRGQATAFLEGSPLNVCDLEFGPDGALYFITGGRGSQSGLYRLAWVGRDETAIDAVDHVPADLQASATARSIRHQLEQLHHQQDASQLDLIWSYLGSTDVWLRFAARVALENQPLDSWRKRVATSPDSPARHAGLLALARIGARTDQKIVLKGLKEWDWGQERNGELLWGLRTLELSLIRQGVLDEVTRPAMLRKLHALPTRESFAVNWMLMEILVSLKSPEVIERTLGLLETAATQEEQIQYARTLTRIEAGWNRGQRERMLTWLQTHRRFPGGKLMPATLQMLRADVEASFSPEEREQLASQLAQLNEPLVADQEPALPTRPLVKAWTMQDLEQDVSMLRPQDRSVDRGRAALTAAICLRCHQFGDRGSQVGPDLTAVGKRFDGRTLLESIIEPSRVIDPKYHNALYQLEDGRVISGRTISVSKEQIGIETDPLTGTVVVVPRADILESKSSDISPMPQGLLNTLTREEILDLIAYLRSGGK